MKLEEAVEILGILGSDCDPVTYKGVEMDARNLDGGIRVCATTNARKIYITYFKARGKQCRGTLSGMVMDRIKG